MQPERDTASDGWIEWHGGECPVAHSSNVEVRFRDGETCDTWQAGDYADWPIEGHVETPDTSNWMHNGSSEDIIAYRVVQS